MGRLFAFCIAATFDSISSVDSFHLFAKRLERGRFAWPRADGGVVSLTSAQLGLLLEGFD
ncbi:IS66 family insertion sequence element accessory protein TnpB [Paraburkholderia sp. D1E]|uniref:IS66 family insertion sequence element accessory protein TnpB n=1 Tax=Paraburkholderia sp. D1E TaxID=3461398 RepID=UPI004045A390